MLWRILPIMVMISAQAGMEDSPWAAYGDFLDFIIRMGGIVLVLTGCGLLLGSLVQFVQYRKNPANTRLSKPITTFIMAWLLIGLSFVPNVMYDDAFTLSDLTSFSLMGDY